LESESELPPPKRLFTVSRFLFLGLLGGLLFVLAWNTVSEARPLNADSAVQSGGAGAFLMAGVGLWVGLIGAFQFTLLKCVFFAFDPEEFQDYTRTHARFSERVKVLSNALDRTWFTLFGGWLFSSLLFILSGFAYLILWQGDGTGWPVAYCAATLLVLVLLLYFCGELLPAVLAVRNLKALTPVSVLMLRFWSLALAPLILPFVHLLRGAVRLRGHDISERFKPLMVETRLLALISASRVNVSLEEDEREMIDHVLEFGQSTAGDIMTPKSGIVGFDTDTPQDEALAIMRETPRSRVLVYNGSFNNIVGVLHTKQILLNPDSDYHEQLHPPLFVEEDTDLVELLAVIRAERTQLAIVLDRWGTTRGVVTFDDLLGAIVGPATHEEEEEEAPSDSTLPTAEPQGGTL